MVATVVLASKVYVEGDARERSLRSLRGLVGDRLADLDADVDLDLRGDDFPRVELDGPDETAARNLLAEEFGEIPDDLEPGGTYVGTLEAWDDEGFVLDAGQRVRVPADGLGLGQGTPAQIRERFGLVQHLPLEFTYGASDETDDEGAGDRVDGGDVPSEADDAEGATDAVDTAADAAATAADAEPQVELSDAERDRLYDWRRGPGRVTVNSATRSEVRATINRAGHAQDIVTVERLGLLEHSVVCREGTDPPGLIASIGQYLPAELRAVV